MKKLLALLAVLLVCTHSWGACYTKNCCRQSSSVCSNHVCNGWCDVSNYTPDFFANQSRCTGTKPIASVSNVSLNDVCRDQSGFAGGCADVYYCDTQAEVDSLRCEIDPTAEGCAVEIDTTLFACTDNVSGNGGLYRLSCKALNGVVTSCNGKTDVDIATDGTLVRPLHGTCAQNGFGTGVIGGATADSTSTPKSANADCFAIIGSKCVMKDKASGNTFTCDCDGSCDYALRSLMAGNSSCTNPYEQPEENDSLTLPLSSDSQEPSSSGSGEGSSPSSSPSGEGNSSDFEYDYTEFLTNIQANTQQTATELGRSNEFLNGIQNNTETANSFLQAIANKDWSPNINVSAPNVNVQGDTNIINVEVQGDTARAPAEIYNFLKDTSGIQGYADQFESDKARWSAWADSIKSVVARALADSVNDTIPVKSLDSGVIAFKGGFNAFKDTLSNSAYNDSIRRWAGALDNNGVIVGSGSDNCPAVLRRQYALTIPVGNTSVTAPLGSLGVYLCEDIGIGITLWAFARALIRFMVAFTCMVWIFKAVTGTDSDSGEE